MFSLFTKGINRIIPFRMDEHEELIGADYCEHNILHPGVGVSRAVSVIKRHDEHVDLGLIPVGKNKGKEYNLKRFSLSTIFFQVIWTIWKRPTPRS